MARTQLKTLFTVTLTSAARSPSHYYGARPSVILGSQLGWLMMKAYLRKSPILNVTC